MSDTPSGKKNDSEKPDFSLVSAIWLTGVMRVMSKGKRKYAAHNWRGGIVASRLVAASFRHLTLWLAGQDIDEDPECSGCQSGDCSKHTRENHLDCASCSIMFARELMITNPEKLDDRHKYGPKELKELIRLMENKKEIL